jgi:hypothetical protein
MIVRKLRVAVVAVLDTESRTTMPYASVRVIGPKALFSRSIQVADNCAR